MNIVRLLLIAVSTVISFVCKAQCPASIADLVSGGTFNCPGTTVFAVGGAVNFINNINYTGDLTLTGVTTATVSATFNWVSGAFNIQGTSGHITIASTGNMTIQSGTVTANDGNNGNLTVNSGGALTINSGASLQTYGASSIAGTLDNSGTIQNSSGNFTISTGTLNNNAGSQLTIAGQLLLNTTGTLNVVALGNVTIGGSATIAGNLTNNGTITTGGSLSIAAATPRVATNNGTMSTSGTLNVGLGGTFHNNGQVSAVGSMNIYGTLNANSGALMTSSTGSFHVNSGATATVAAGAQITTGSTGDNNVYGTLTINGTINYAGDLVIDGASANVIMNAGAEVNILRDPDGDLEVTNGGTFTMNGGDLYVFDDITTEINGDASNPSIGHFIINGTVTVDDDIVLHDGSTLTSSTVGAGQIAIGDDFLSDPGCPYTSGVTIAFCHCIGSNQGGAICGSALPVTLTRFSGAQKDNVINFSWETATETNNHFFTIDRLLSNDNFEPILTLPGSGTTFLPVAYEAIDAHPLDGKNYYRLKQTDYDGTTEAFNIIMVEFERKEISYHVFPNPTRNRQFNIDASGFEPAKNVKVTLLTSQGSMLSGFNFSADQFGRLNEKIETPASGLYIVDIAGKRVKLIAE